MILRALGFRNVQARNAIAIVESRHDVAPSVEKTLRDALKVIAQAPM